LFPRKGANVLFLQEGEEQTRASLKRYEEPTDRIWRAFQWQPQKALTYTIGPYL